MSNERWVLIFVLIAVLLLHLATLPAQYNPWLSVPGLLGAALVIFFADFIGFIFGQVIPTEKWPKIIRVFGWILLMLDPLNYVMLGIVEMARRFINS